MIKIVGLWIAVILSSFIGLVAKELYKPVQRVADVLLTLYLLLILSIQLAAIYFTALRSPFGAMIAIILFFYYWSYFAPFYPNSDPAGNGMAMGFRSFFVTVASLFWGVVSYLLIRFLKSDGGRPGLYIVLAIAACVGLYNLFANRKSHLSGDAFRDDARWAGMRVEDYRKALFRSSMVESGDSWEARDLDAVPKEIEYWEVEGCNCMHVMTHEQYPCLLLEGIFEFENETGKIHRTGSRCGCLGYAYGEYIEDPLSFIPKHISLVWHDLADRKTYTLQTDLPKDLNRYFADTERFRFDDLEFRIMPAGRVAMFHNRHHQIHNIQIDYPLQGEVTNEYEQAVSDLIQKDNIDVTKYSHSTIPSAEDLDNYQKRFKYSISFRTEKDDVEITKTICNFFNGDKILSGGVWKEEPELSRIKDVFLRFEDKERRYACFVYFDEYEIIRAFEEAFGNDSDAQAEFSGEAREFGGDAQAEFSITVGELPSAFAFELKNGGKSITLKKTEIRLYTVDADERGKLVFKNYKGRHKNVFPALTGRTQK